MIDHALQKAAFFTRFLDRLPDGRPRVVFDRITSRVVVRADGCWAWTGPTSGEKGRGRGYARMSLDGQTVAVHRVMFMLFNGPIPSRKHIDHTCRQRNCVNPDHLEMVTHRENCRRRDQCSPD